MTSKWYDVRAITGVEAEHYSAESLMVTKNWPRALEAARELEPYGGVVLRFENDVLVNAHWYGIETVGGALKRIAEEDTTCRHCQLLGCDDGSICGGW